MDVKINSTVTSAGATQAGGRAKETARTPRQPATAGNAGEQVALSSLAARLQETSAALAETPAIDAAHVAEIKHAISTGQFQINPEKIADGLVDSVRQMLAKQR